MKLHTNFVIGLAIAAAGAGIGFGIYTHVQDAVDEHGLGQSGTFASLQSLGKNLRCEFSYEDGTNQSKSTFYMANGGKDLRFDFNVVSGGHSVEGHLIRVGGFNYVWGSQIKGGVKLKVEQETEYQLLSASNNLLPIDTNTTYHCVPWVVDTERLLVPQDIQFMDLGAYIENTRAMHGSLDAPDMQVSPCGSCDFIPDAEIKAQCRAALSCE